MSWWKSGDESRLTATVTAAIADTITAAIVAAAIVATAIVATAIAATAIAATITAAIAATTIAAATIAAAITATIDTARRRSTAGPRRWRSASIRDWTMAAGNKEVGCFGLGGNGGGSECERCHGHARYPA
jgi:hypothetical protein